MDTKDLLQINDFGEGMNTDTSDALMSKSSYRLSNNLRYITNTSENSGELHMIEGAKKDIYFVGESIVECTNLRDLEIYVTQADDKSYWAVRTRENGSDMYTAAKIPAEKGRVIDKKLSLVTRYEDYDNQKLYIADGMGPVLSIQLYPLRVDGLKVIRHEKLNDITSYPSMNLSKPIFCGLIDGTLDSYVVSYSYQLYTKYGKLSEISPSTKLIPIYKGALLAKDAGIIEGYLNGDTTNKGVKIKINISSDDLLMFDRIKIYRVSYKEVGLLPQIDCVQDSKLESTNITINDSGLESLQVLTLEEYNSITGIHIIPKTIESKDDYLFAANIKQDEEQSFYSPNWDATSNITHEFVTIDILADECADDEGNVKKDRIYFPHGTNWFKNTGITYKDKNKIEGTFSVADYVTVEQQDVNAYQNAKVSYMFRSLRRGETYRFGIVLYNYDGMASPVYHYKDITIDDSLIGDDIFDEENGNLIVHPVGIKFHVTNLPSTTKYYEIVRCGKSVNDVLIVAQGVLSRPISKSFTFGGNTNNYPLTPSGFITVHDLGMSTNNTNNIYHTLSTNYCYLDAEYNENPITAPISDAITGGYRPAWRTPIDPDKEKPESSYKYSIPNYNIFLFICPEYSYLEDTIKDELKGLELFIKPIKYIYPYKNQEEAKQHKLVLVKVRDDEGNELLRLVNVYNFGNDYANITTGKPISLHDDDYGKVPFIEVPFDVYMSYYTKYSSYNEGDEIIFHDTNWEEDEEKGITGSDEFKELMSDNNGENRYQYCKLYYKESVPEVVSKDYEITSVGFPETLNWDNFASPVTEGFQLIYTDKVVQVGGRNYTNWVCGSTYGLTDQTELEIHSTDCADNWSLCAMGPGGKCIVVSVDDNKLSMRTKIGNEEPSGFYRDNYFISTFLCNLYKKSSKIKSSDEEDIKQSIYRSFGDIYNKDVTDPIVFDGDCFVNVFEYVAEHKFAHIFTPYWRTSCNVYAIPMETSINLAYTSGYEFSKYILRSQGDVTWLLNQAGNVNGIFGQEKPLYSYNSVYSATDTSKTLISKEKFDDGNDLQNTDYRVYHSLLKTNNESVDNWLKYQPANFLDVDTRNGAITGLRKFKNYLVFWQECATGLLSVNERSMISDDSNLPLILGSGGVLTRFDYITNQNGMHLDDYSDIQSNTTLYWWDRMNKTICGYAGGLEVLELSKVKFILNYLNKNNPIDNPTLVYDDRFNEAIFNVVDGTDHEDGSLVYNEHLGKFTSIYGVRPEHKIELPERVLMTTDKDVYLWDKLFDTKNARGLKNEILTPYLKYIVNAQSVYTKVFDNGEFAGRVYGGDNLSDLKLTFATPLKQYSELSGNQIENREYNFKYVVPRNLEDGEQPLYGGRLRGKTMQCELESTNNSYDFSLQFIKNKFRISWS